MLINQRLTDTKGSGWKKRNKQCEMRLSVNMAGGRGKWYGDLILMHSYWLRWAGVSRAMCPRLEREREEGEEITWYCDLFLVSNLMMNTRLVHHGRLSQWGPVSLWLDSWHMYPPLSKGRVTPMERKGAGVHNWQEENYVAIIVNHRWIWATTPSAFIKLSEKRCGLLMPLREE